MNKIPQLILSLLCVGFCFSAVAGPPQTSGEKRTVYMGRVEGDTFFPVYKEGLYVENGTVGGAQGLRSGDSVVFTPEFAIFNGKKMYYPWNVMATTNWMNYASVTNDSFATEWWVNNLIDTTVGRLTVVGRKELLDTYTNNPPHAITNLHYYVGECIKILAATEVAPAVDDYTNTMRSVQSILTTKDGVFSIESNSVMSLDYRVSDLEKLKERPAIGAGADDFDWILDLNVDDIVMEDLLKATKAMALYIKNGKTNGFDKVR